jgi:hypothetical protein
VKRFFAIMILLLITGCAGIRVNYDYDPQISFEGYKTFGYYPDLDSGLGELDERRLLEATNEALSSRGFRFSEEPDFWININSVLVESPPSSNIGIGMGGGGRNVGGGISIGVPVSGPTLQYQITFDLLDRQRESLVWQAFCSVKMDDTLQPEARVTRFNDIAHKVFSAFPPGN